MVDKTKDELEIENAFLKHTEEERSYMERKFAIKLVERVVFGLIALIAVAVITGLLGLIIKN